MTGLGSPRTLFAKFTGGGYATDPVAPIRVRTVKKQDAADAGGGGPMTGCGTGL
jgi:hypothetical protein